MLLPSLSGRRRWMIPGRIRAFWHETHQRFRYLLSCNRETNSAKKHLLINRSGYRQTIQTGRGNPNRGVVQTPRSGPPCSTDSSLLLAAGGRLCSHQSSTTPRGLHLLQQGGLWPKRRRKRGSSGSLGGLMRSGPPWQEG